MSRRPMLPGVLDRAFSAVFRNFSTLFLVAVFIVAPLQIGHAFAFNRVIAVADLHEEIEGFPEERQVKSVGRTQLNAYRTTSAVIFGLEVLLLPFMAGAARRVFRDEEEGKVPTAIRAWKGAAREVRPSISQVRGSLPFILTGAVSAAVIGLLTLRIGSLLAQFFPDSTAFIGVGLAHTISHSMALPLLFGVWAAASPDATVDNLH